MSMPTPPDPAPPVPMANNVEGSQPPPWFQEAIHQALQPLYAEIDSIRECLGWDDEEVAKLRRNSALEWNGRFCVTPTSPLYVVLFPDGTDPTKPPHSLPPIASVAVLNGLSPQIQDAYLQNYYPGVPLPAVGQRRDRLGKALGINLSILAEQ